MIHIRNFPRYFLLFLLFFANNTSNSKESSNPKIPKRVWNLEKTFPERIIWELDNENETQKFEEAKTKRILHEELTEIVIANDYEVRALGRAVTVNNLPYPDLSIYVPNAFVENNFKNFTFALRGISRTRTCFKRTIDCADAIFNVDMKLFSSLNQSLTMNWNVQSLSSRNDGTEFGSGQSLGVKFAKQFSENLSFSIGGENIFLFDNVNDLGRNFYFIASTFKPLNFNNKKAILFLNAGIGSDFYGYRGNGFLGEMNCFSTPNLTGDGTNKCNIGPIGSLSIAFNERFALINEWFGYGYGSGFSIKPFKNHSLSISLLATDFIKGFPKYIERDCANNDCSPRIYGNLSFSF